MLYYSVSRPNYRVDVHEKHRNLFILEGIGPAGIDFQLTKIFFLI